MSSLPWLRLYTEIIDDPKTGTLSDAAFRTYIELLCLARRFGETGETGMTAEELDWKLRRNVTVTLQELLQKDLVTEGGDEKISIPAFSDRQRKSDSSAERVRKFRENKKKAKCNVTETEEKRPKSKSKKENKSKYKPEDLSLARKMFHQILIVAPKTKEPNFESWANIIRLMRERDDQPLMEIEKVFMWANGHHFWATNILSPSKLREKFSTLDAQMRKPHATSQRPNQPSSAVGRVAAGNAERSRQREEALSRQGSTIDDTGIIVESVN